MGLCGNFPFFPSGKQMFAAESGWNLCYMELIYYDYLFKLQKINEERNLYFELTKKNFLSFEVEGCIVNDSLMNISVSVNATFFIWPKLFFADCFPRWRFSCALRAYVANSPKKMQKFSCHMDFIVIFLISLFALTFWNMLGWEKYCRSFCTPDLHTGLLTHELPK